jgi:N-acetylated-alpha-linked acidic dipeptidase
MGVLGAVALTRLADAEIIPYDYVEYARAMRALTATAAKNIAAKGWTSVSMIALDSSINVMEKSAGEFNAARDAALARGVQPAARKQANEQLMQVERGFVRPQGLPVTKREWFRNVIYAADNDNGYANIGLPSINEAVHVGDQALSVREIADLTQRFLHAATLLDAAARSLRAP